MAITFQGTRRRGLDELLRTGGQGATTTPKARTRATPEPWAPGGSFAPQTSLASTGTTPVPGRMETSLSGDAPSYPEASAGAPNPYVATDFTGFDSWRDAWHAIRDNPNGPDIGGNLSSTYWDTRRWIKEAYQAWEERGGAIDETVNEAVGEADLDYDEFMAGVQDYLDQLGELVVPTAPDFGDITAGIQGVQAGLQQPVDEDDILEAQARAAGFVDASGAVDVPGYLAQVGQLQPGEAPDFESTTLTPEQERAQRAFQRQADESAILAVESVMANTGAFMRAMATADEQLARIADSRAQMTVQMLNDTFANNLASFEAKNNAYNAMINQGQMTRQQYMNERYETAQLSIDAYLAEASTLLDEYQGERDAFVAQASQIMDAATIFMTGTAAGLDVWQGTFERIMEPFLTDMELTEAMEGDGFDWGAFFSAFIPAAAEIAVAWWTNRDTGGEED